MGKDQNILPSILNMFVLMPLPRSIVVMVELLFLKKRGISIECLGLLRPVDIVGLLVEKLSLRASFGWEKEVSQHNLVWRLIL